MLSVYKVAKWGARHALPEVGLDGRESARDISELRSLLGAFNEAKKTAGLTIVRMLFTELVLALLAGELVKLKVFGGDSQEDAAGCQGWRQPEVEWLCTGAMRRSRFCDDPMRRSISRCAAWY